MFDAYFAPPFLQPADALHMAQYGVTHCVLAIRSAHCETSVRPEANAHNFPAHHPQTSPKVRQKHARELLEDVGITVFVADAISSHLEPERNWEAQWASLVARVEAGQVAVLGVMDFQEENGRSMDILDRHLALSKVANLPIYVKSPHHFSSRGRAALVQRAQTHAQRWYWVHPELTFAHSALLRGEGAILSPHRRVSADDLVTLATLLPKHARGRLKIASSSGRGLNPFALASMEIAGDVLNASRTLERVLEDVRLVELPPAVTLPPSRVSTSA